MNNLRLCCFWIAFSWSLVTISAAEKIVLVAGGGSGADGTAAIDAAVKAPFGVEFDKAGNLYLVEMYGHKFRMIDTAGKIHTLAGTGTKGHTGDDGPAKAATLNGPHSLAIGKNGKVYLADTWNHCCREYDPTTKTIKTVVGNGTLGFAGDNGPGEKAQFNEFYDAVFDKTGEQLYIVDLKNRRIRKWDSAKNIVTTVAGNGNAGTPKNGALAIESPLNDPRAVAVDSKNNIYILERGGNSLRVVDPAGKIKTVAGTGKKGPLTADGPALAATFSGPKFLWCDHNDDVLIADSDNHCIRKYVATTGQLVLVAGTGKPGTKGLNGPPRDCELNQPHGIYQAPDKTLYISDSTNNRILRIVNE
jgi:hypothetical protein